MTELADTYTPPVNENEQTFTILGDIASSHIDRNPFLKVAQYDQDQPLHQLDMIFLESGSIDLNSILEIAQEYHPGFEETMVEPFLDRPKLLHEITESLQQGKNIGVFTAHESLMDIMWTTLALNIALAKTGLGNFEERTQDTDLVVSRTVLSLDIDLQDKEQENVILPSAEMVRLCGNLHFSLPDSKRIRNSNISEKVIQDNNLKVVRNLIERLKHTQQGLLVGIALPGTVDELSYDLQGKPNKIVIQTVKKPTMSLMKRLDLALPVAVVTSGEKECCIPGDLQEIPDEKGTHLMMAKIAGTRTWATGINTWYRQSDSRVS